MSGAGGPETYAVEVTEDPAAFLAVAGDLLAADPLLTTVVSTVTQRALAAVMAGDPPPDHPRWWASVLDGSGAVVGLAMRTAPFAPHPPFVLAMPEAAARALARAVLDRGESLGGVNGSLPTAQVVADEAARLTGRRAEVHEHTRLFELGELVEPAPVPGRLRAATPDDAALALAWFNAFAADAAEQAGRSRATSFERHDLADMLQRIQQRRVWLWEDEAGETVHLTGHGLPAYGVARIGPVYTPSRHRGRGYASAGVAAVSRRLRAEGARVCLFTDQANPTSNKIYEALGFRRVVDMANLVLVP